MMPAPFNKLCRGLDRSPGNQMSLDQGDKAGYDSNSWPSGLIILWMTMEEHYTQESVIFFNGYYYLVEFISLDHLAN